MSLSPELVGVIGVVVLLLLMIAQMWIGFAMGIIGFLGFAYIRGFKSAFSLLAIEPYTVLSDYSLSVIPMFILMGVIASNTEITKDLFRSAHAWIGQLPGGLAMATTVACALFAAICGSSLAGTVTMGKVAVPEMKKYNYANSLVGGCVAAGGTLGILIPPSIGFILYAILTEQSVGKLFMAGIAPGILLTLLFIILITLLVLINPNLAPPSPRSTFRTKIKTLKHTWAMITIFIIVMGGIYAGIFTPTEAGAIGVFGTVIITFFGKRLSGKILITSIVDTVLTSGMIAGIVIGAFIFMRFMTVSQLPFALANFLSSIHLSNYGIFVIILILYVILGMFTDIISSIVITIPVIYPVITSLGFDPIWFGVIVVLVMEMGMITPPIGINVFVLSGLTRIPVSSVFRGVWPFVLAEIVCITLLTIWPQIVMFIPNRM